MAEIIPAVMPESYEDLREKLGVVSDFVPWVQIDVMDGRFVGSKSWPYNIRSDQNLELILSEEEGLPFWDRLNFEVDLMVAHPAEEAKQWIRAGAERLVIHLESLKENVVDLLEEVKNANVEVGLALDMATAIDKVLPFVNNLDFVQLMGIDYDGYQGVPFDEKVLEKIKELKKKAPSIIVSVDGGVSLETAPSLVSDGADRLVVGSSIFKSNDIAGTIEEFKMI